MLELRQTQKLMPVLTQQLQQAIRLLQLSKPELLEAIEQEVKENPILEVEESKGDESPAEPASETASEDREDVTEWLEKYSPSEEYEPRQTREEREFPSFDNLVKKSSNLRDYIRWQVGLSDFSPDERITAEWLIEDIDDNGYLAYNLAEIAETSSIPEEVLERALKKIQKLDPPGVGARNLKECILIQYEARGDRDPIFEHVVTKYFDLFQKANLKEIAKKTGCPLEKIRDVLETIKSFDPKPGRNYGDDYAAPIVPDVYVIKVKDDFDVLLNDDEVPELRMSRYYVDLYASRQVSGDTRRYIKGKIKQAEWFIKSIQQRQKTLFLVSKSLVGFQKEFLDKGIRFLKPLNLRDVAQDITMHESTVSRVTTNKYMSTPQGIYEMKFFFPSALNKDDSDALSTNFIMDLIGQLISGEDKAHPLTDDEIVTRLKEMDHVQIARRTIVKYREILHIPSSRARKVSD
jgi:RNA polymerase sigma-54 factor